MSQTDGGNQRAATFPKGCNALQDNRPATESPQALVNNTGLRFQNLGLNGRICILKKPSPSPH